MFNKKKINIAFGSLKSSLMLIEVLKSMIQESETFFEEETTNEAIKSLPEDLDLLKKQTKITMKGKK
jgi:hypothetical protein